MPASEELTVSDELRNQRTGLDKVPETERDEYVRKELEAYAQKARELRTRSNTSDPSSKD
jgi:hypothetical protein